MSDGRRSGVDAAPRRSRDEELAAVLAECARDTAESQRRVAERRGGTARRVVRWAAVIGLAIAILRLLRHLAE